ncbi:segregation/condensation protein A [Patescibacteria group bacterium]|nr:segregation/condensation protein A [Patescibacteria group bacterium]
MAYQVKTAIFEGSLEVLLNLIEKRKLSINTVSLGGVVEEYLGHLKTLGRLPRAETASFLVVASTLILIKSRTLLPTLELDEEESASIEELETRLRELKEFRRLSKYIQEYVNNPNMLFSREAFCGHEFGFLPPQRLVAGDLHFLLRRIVESFEPKDSLPEKTLTQVISIEEKTRDLINRLSGRVFGSLESIISGKDKAELIVGFLAILELMKQGFFEISQKDIFGEVELRKVL